MHNFVSKTLRKFPQRDEPNSSSFEDLTFQNRLYDAVLSSLQEGIAVSDKKHKILYFNRRLSRILQLSEWDSRKSLWELFDEQSLRSFVKKSLLSDDAFYHQRFSLEDKILSLSLLPLVESGNLEGNILIMHDITQSQKQASLEQGSQSLEFLSKMSASVAHEIKNPLGALSIHVQLLQKALEKNVDPQLMKPYLRVLHEEIERLNDIVSTFLLKSRPVQLHPRAQSLNEIIKKTLELISPELQSVGIKLFTHWEEPLPEVFIDGQYIKQVFLNLIKNAKDALISEKDPQIDIRTLAKDGWVIACVQDNGPGIPIEEQERIFDPYWSSKIDGSGLGLTLVMKIINDHKGQLTLHSRKGKGTLFSILFPPYQSEHPLLPLD